MSMSLLWTIISAVGFALSLFAFWANLQTYLYAQGQLTAGHVAIARGQVRRSLMRWIVLGIFLAAGLTVEIAPTHAGWVVKGLVAGAALIVLQEAWDAFDIAKN